MAAKGHVLLTSRNRETETKAQEAQQNADFAASRGEALQNQLKESGVKVFGGANFVLHAWLRSGNSGTWQGAGQFLSEALQLLGSAYRVRCVRADSDFYADNFLSFLEARALLTSSWPD